MNNKKKLLAIFSICMVVFIILTTFIVIKLADVNDKDDINSTESTNTSNSLFSSDVSDKEEINLTEDTNTSTGLISSDVNGKDKTNSSKGKNTGTSSTSGGGNSKGETNSTASSNTGSGSISSDEKPSEDSLKALIAQNGMNSVAKTATLSGKKFSSLPAEYTVLLNNNPDRGWASNETMRVPGSGHADQLYKLDYTYEQVLADLKHRVKANTYDQDVKISRLFFIMQDYKTVEEIPEKAWTYMQNILKAYREMGIKVFLNIYYQHGLQDTVITYPILEKHIPQYAEKIWKPYKDVIFSNCLSLVGSYGEWAAYANGVGGIPGMTLDERQKVVNLVLKYLPEEINLTFREPKLKEQFVLPTHPRYKYIGYDQASFFEYFNPHPEKDTCHQGDFRPGHRYYTDAMKQAPYAVMFSETFTTDWFQREGGGTHVTELDALDSIKSLSEQRVTAFNINHAYGDITTYGGDVKDAILYKWCLKKISKGVLNNIGVLCTDSWFKDSHNKTVVRSAFDYIREYLGYHLSIGELSVTGGNNLNDRINVSVNLRNYGFSAAFNLESGFAILDKNNNLVSEVKAGTPTDWHSTSPTDYSDRTQLSHTVSADMNLPSKAGTYKIAFFLRNKMGDTARLDNLVEYANGYNILHTFNVN